MQITFGIIFFFSTAVWGDSTQAQVHQSHDGHNHYEMLDGVELEVDPSRLAKFIASLSNVQVAVVSVKGMVCDFCARGIEKTFTKDNHVKKIDVDLSKGKVLIAYGKEKKIDYEDVKQKIQANGQNATDIMIFNI